MGIGILIGIAFYDLNGLPFKEFYGTPAMLFNDISSGFWNYFGIWNTKEVIPSETIAIGLAFALHDPNSSKDITYDIALIEVRDIDYIVEKQIPAGDPEISFDPIPVKLDFSYNQDPGIATAEETFMPFGSLDNSFCLSKSSSWYWDLIPLTDWSVYDTLEKK